MKKNHDNREETTDGRQQTAAEVSSAASPPILLPSAVCCLQTDLPPELSALEASLGSLEPLTSPGSAEAVKSNALLRLFETAPLTGEKLIETIVKTGDQEITLSLRDFVKSARLIAGLYGSAIGVLVGLLLGIGLMLLIVKPAVREIHHVPMPYFVNDVMKER